MKRLTAVLLSVILIMCSVPAFAFSSGNFKNGDVNKDKTLSVKDATLIQHSIAKLRELDNTQKKLADYDLNGLINIKDATKIQKVIARIDTAPEETVEETIPVETEDIGIIETVTTASTEPETTEAPAETTTAPTETATATEATAAPTEETTAPETAQATAPNPVPNSNVDVYFTNNKNWSKVYFFVYNSEKGTGLKAWPGVQVTKYTTNDNGEKVYSMKLDTSKYDRIVFNDGADTKQTANVSLNRASSGFFISDSSNAKQQLVGTYAYKGADKGTLKELSFDYPMGYKKKVWIWTPADYNPDSKDPYKTIYMPDGQNIFDFKGVAYGGWEVSDAVESLMANGGRGVILVGIETTGTKRDTELTPNIGEIQQGVGNQYKNGKGKEFSDFVVDTIMPYVQENYNSSTARVDNYVAGSSSGGLEAFYIGMEHHDKFCAIGALSPAFIIFGDKVWNDYLSKYDFSAADMPKIYIYDGKVGLEDTLYPFIEDMKDRLLDGGYDNNKIKFVVEEKAEHNEAWWRHIYPETLDWMLF